MEITYSEQAQEDIDYWKKSGNKAIMNKITTLLKDTSGHPYTGIGKPESLKYELSGKCSRRITSDHRMVYIVRESMNDIYVLSLRYHYPQK
ncbi:MAG: Txe/YoeB family addiction module toxin [Prolixibacteraceae bacterium]